MRGFRSFSFLALVLVLATGVAGSSQAQNGPGNWQVPKDFATIQNAIDSPMVLDGDTIRVGPGNFAGALVTKAVNIVGKGRATIDDGPAHSSGLVQGFRLLTGSDGASIGNLTFAVDLPIMNGDGVDFVTVTQNRFDSAIQAISAWRGSHWTIAHNEIEDLRTANGGGIGILVGDFDGGVVEGNVVAHNRVEGTLHVSPVDGGGYNGSGLVLFADFRFGRAGAAAIEGNRVTHNKVAMSSDTPAVVDVVAFELTDTRDDAAATPFPVLFDNSVGFNDFRGTTLQIALTPVELQDHNLVSRNLGDNRGHGAHPLQVFQPGG